MNKIKTYEWLKKQALKALTVFMGLSCSMFISQKNTDTKPNTTKTEIPDLKDYTMEEAFQKGWCKSIVSYIEKASHISDTTYINTKNYDKRICDGFYILPEDEVHLKYFIPDTTGASPNIAKKIILMAQRRNDTLYWKSNKAHEYKHRHTRQKGTFSAEVSPEDYARLCQHNEIASYIANLLYEREIYIEALQREKIDKKQLTGLISSRFAAYRQAIEKNEILPGTNNPLWQQKENKLIAKIVSDWWIKNEQKQNVYITRQYLKHKMSDKKFIRRRPNPKAYEKALDGCYTFIKDGKLVNLNFFYKSSGKAPLLDVEPQPEIKAYLQEMRQKDKQSQKIAQGKLPLCGIDKNPARF